MVENLDGARPFFAAVVRPSEGACQHVFRPLEPLVANNRGRSRLWVSPLDCAPCERINMIASDRGLLALHAAPHGDAAPRVRHLAIKFAWIQPVDHAPCSAAERHCLLGLPWSLAIGAV